MVKNCLILLHELEKIYNGFGISMGSLDGIPNKVQKGVIRVSCSDTGDLSDLFIFFHYLMVFKMIFYNASPEPFESFIVSFLGESAVNVMSIRGMLAHSFRKISRLINEKESLMAEALNKELPLAFFALRENSLRIHSKPFCPYR